MKSWEVGSDGSLRGRQLRYVLVQLLHDHKGVLSVRHLIAECEALGIVFDGRASKIISDALRWELRRGRVHKVARGVYAYRYAPRSTLWRIRKRVAEYIERLAELQQQRMLAPFRVDPGRRFEHATPLLQ